MKFAEPCTVPKKNLLRLRQRRRVSWPVAWSWLKLWPCLALRFSESQMSQYVWAISWSINGSWHDNVTMMYQHRQYNRCPSYSSLKPQPEIKKLLTVLNFEKGFLRRREVCWTLHSAVPTACGRTGSITCEAAKHDVTCGCLGCCLHGTFKLEISMLVLC